MQRARMVVESLGRLALEPGAAGFSCRSYSSRPDVSQAAKRGSARLGRLAAAAAAAVGLPSGTAAAQAQQPPSPEELAKPGATSIREAEGLEGKLSGCEREGAAAARCHAAA